MVRRRIEVRIAGPWNVVPGPRTQGQGRPPHGNADVHCDFREGRRSLSRTLSGARRCQPRAFRRGGAREPEGSCRALLRDRGPVGERRAAPYRGLRHAFRGATRGLLRERL